MKNKKICSLKIRQNPEHQQNEKGDFSANFEFSKSQVTEQKAIDNAIEQFNETLSNGLCARIADTEQCIQTKGDKVLMQIGIDLFTKN